MALGLNSKQNMGNLSIFFRPVWSDWSVWALQNEVCDAIFCLARHILLILICVKKDHNDRKKLTKFCLPYKLKFIGMTSPAPMRLSKKYLRSCWNSNSCRRARLDSQISGFSNGGTCGRRPANALSIAEEGRRLLWTCGPRCKLLRR